MSLCLPILKEEEKPGEEELLPAQVFQEKHLLVVEDNDINLEIALLILGETGFVIDTARNGQEAVDQVKAVPEGTYDAILMDIQMPVMDGNEATRLIRALPGEKGRVPIAAMTANVSQEDRAVGREAGMDAFIPKPFQLPQMEKTLMTLLTLRRGTGR